MRYKLKFSSKAENDLTEAVLWYEGKFRGLGKDLLFNTDVAINSIQKMPEAYPIINKNVRRILIKKFPFSIYYILK